RQTSNATSSSRPASRALRQRMHLARRAHCRLPSRNPQSARLPPDRPRPNRYRVAPELRKDGLDEVVGICDIDARMDDEREPREPAFILLLDELVVDRGAAEARRKDVVEDAHHVARNERHPVAGELAVAVDVPDVVLEADLLEGASARPAFDRPVVV